MGAQAQKKPRLNLELDHRTKERLDRLREQTDAASITEVIRRSLRLYDIVTEHVANGGVLILRTNDTDRELLILG